MKKLITTLIILLYLASFSFGADFRNVNWGMTPSEVKQNESIVLHHASIDEFISGETDDNIKKIKEHISVLEGRTIEDNMFKFIKYAFLDDRLQEVTCIIQEYSEQRGTYIRQYMNLDRALTAKYGEPTIHKDNFFDKKNDSYLNGISLWKLPDGMEISHRFFLSDTERFPIHRIFYNSKIMRNFYDKLEEENKKQGQ